MSEEHNLILIANYLRRIARALEKANGDVPEDDSKPGKATIVYPEV